ncbi:MAG: hypothetical protein JXA67_21670 [Micromonosporaceae bacterium]|nr:hypothetical protein [Micromonosporaceae bacterium]
MGPDGWLRLGPPFHRSGEVRAGRPGQPEKTTAAPFDGDGHQIRGVVSCLAAGRLESPGVPWADTLAVLRAVEEIRQVWVTTPPTHPTLPPANALAAAATIFGGRR